MERLLRLPEVKATTGIASTTGIYDRINEGLFPKQVRCGTRSVAWVQSEVQAYLAYRVAGKSDAELKCMISRLHAKRIEGVTL